MVAGLGFASLLTKVQARKRWGGRAIWKVLRYHGTLVHIKQTSDTSTYVEVERVQTGVRIEKHLLKVLKAVAELKDMTLGDLLEGVILHAFEGKTPFSAETLKEVEQFKKIYGMTLRAVDSHHLKERRK